MASSTVLPRESAGPSLLSVAVGEGQGQFSHSHDPKASSLASHRWQGTRGGEVGIFSLFAPPHNRQESGSDVLCSAPLGWILCNPHIQGQRYCVSQVRYRGHPPSAAAGGGQRQLSSPHDPMETALSLAAGGEGKREGISPLLMAAHSRQRQADQLFHIHAFGLAYLQRLHPGPAALLCCPDKVLVPFS